MTTATLPLLTPRRPATPDGPWILTASGRPFSLLQPEDSVIDIADIAEALAKLCRWTGHTATFYSVAQHSGLVHDMLPLNARPYGLLHDAKEGFIGDWSTPLKGAVAIVGGPQAAEAIAALEDRIDAAIHRAAGLAWPPPPEIAAAVKAADMRALVTEKRDLMPADGPDWGIPLPPPSSRTITPVPWPRAHNDFLARFDALCRVFPDMAGLRRS